MHVPLATLRTELADLAFELERKGRRDAADVLMMLDIRVQEMAGMNATVEDGDETRSAQSSIPAEYSP